MSEEVHVNIRQAVGDDAKELLQSIAQMKQETQWVEIDEEAFQLSLEDLALQIDAVAQHPSNLLLVAILGEEVIGLVTIREVNEASSSAEFGIVIKKDFWGMGLGQMMTEEALFWVDEGSNLLSLFLTVYKENKPAIHLYEKMGFKFKENQSETKQVMTYDCQ